MEAQAADLLHLLDAARSLHCALVLAALGQLQQDVRLVVHPGADDKWKAEALFILLVETGHALGFPRGQRVHSGSRLLLARLPGQGASLQVPAGQIGVTP